MFYWELLAQLENSHLILTKSCLEVPTLRKGTREGEVQRKNETDTLQKQITFNKVRRGSSQTTELLH